MIFVLRIQSSQILKSIPDTSRRDLMGNFEYVQKGIGTLLRGLWKIYPLEIEVFLLKWKDQCGRLIIQYST